MTYRSSLSWFFSTLLICSTGLRLDAEPPRRIVPEPGIEIPAAERRVLQSSVDTLGREFEKLARLVKGDARREALLPDVQIYHLAVKRAVEQNLFYNKKEFEIARTLLRQGMERTRQLAAGQAPWTTATGLVVRGYVSDIDGSVQPYGLVVPDSWKAGAGGKFRLDFWFHGRDNKLSELKLIDQRQTKAGQFTPRDTFVLHPYGRYCNANKFAGEADNFEALAHAMRHYPIDPDKLSVRGFSMGGAVTWHMAAHHAGRWAAAAPGAGFAETEVYQNIWKKEPQPTWWEQKLWGWYDADICAPNFAQCPVIAYSGEKDAQKASADLMEAALKKAGIDIVHIIGPGMGHKYHPDSIKEIDRRMDALVNRGREKRPRKLRFVTYTLRYNQMLWLTVDELDEHWTEARVEAEVLDDQTVALTTANVAAFSLSGSGGVSVPVSTDTLKVEIDRQRLSAVKQDGGWRFRKVNGQWQAVGTDETSGLTKRHGLQGPIDDAFVGSFLMVAPSGTATDPAVGAWLADELKNAVYQWNMQFRGEPRVKAAADVTEEDIRKHHLILWGDPASNPVLKRLINRLPLEWDGRTGRLGQQAIARGQVPVLIFPNPLNPERYVVLNSGFTFSEYGNQSNSMQVPKLPDWAVLDPSVPRAKRIPAGVRAAGFFDEKWAWQAPRP